MRVIACTFQADTSPLGSLPEHRPQPVRPSRHDPVEGGAHCINFSVLVLATAQLVGGVQRVVRGVPAPFDKS